MSIGRSPRASRRRASIARMSWPRGNGSKGISTATSSNSHCAGPGEGRMARAPSTTVLSSAGSAGLQMSVATRDIWVNSSRGQQQGRAYRRADRQRQVGAGARARAKNRRRRHQRRFHAGVSRSPHPHGAADAGGGGAGSAPALWPCRRRGEFLRGQLGGRCRQGACGSARAEIACRFSSAAPACISRR